MEFISALLELIFRPVFEIIGQFIINFWTEMMLLMGGGRLTIALIINALITGFICLMFGSGFGLVLLLVCLFTSALVIGEYVKRKKKHGPEYDFWKNQS